MWPPHYFTQQFATPQYFWPAGAPAPPVIALSIGLAAAATLTPVGTQTHAGALSLLTGATLTAAGAMVVPVDVWAGAAVVRIEADSNVVEVKR